MMIDRRVVGHFRSLVIGVCSVLSVGLEQVLFLGTRRAQRGKESAGTRSGKVARFGKILMGAQKKLGQVYVAEGRKGWCQLSSRHGLKV